MKERRREGARGRRRGPKKNEDRQHRYTLLTCWSEVVGLFAVLRRGWGKIKIIAIMKEKQDFLAHVHILSKAASP